jgi:hypothetical protein
MTPDETARLLGKCAAYDQRTVGRMDIAAWTEVLADVDLVDALPAVAAHYRVSTKRIMPADVRERSAEYRDQRRRTERRTPLAVLPPGRHDDDPDRDARIAAGVAQARAILPPEPVGDAVYRRAVARAHRERGRPEPLKRRRGHKAKQKPLSDGPADERISDLAKHYLRDGWDADQVADRLGISRQWCRKHARRLAPLGPVGWCGKCTYDGRMRKDSATSEPKPCPDCRAEAS